MAGYKSCETCAFFGEKGGVKWCFKNNYSTSASGGSFCSDWKAKW